MTERTQPDGICCYVWQVKRTLPHRVDECALLDDQECREIRDRVIGLRAHWTNRRGSFFFTLGAAAYLDGEHDREPYLSAARTANPILVAHFMPLLERVRSSLECFLHLPVVFDESLALPGFQIFVFDGRDQRHDNPAARAHFDLPWLRVLPHTTPDQFLSFTLLIDEPTGGASLQMWNARFESARTANVSAAEFASNHKFESMLYSWGELIAHDGLTLHAIGRSLVATPRGYRITLQGHGLLLNSRWLIYW